MVTFLIKVLLLCFTITSGVPVTDVASLEAGSRNMQQTSVGSTGTTGATGGPASVVSYTELADVAQCSVVPTRFTKSCLALLQDLMIELLRIIQLGNNNVELSTKGSAVDKAKNLCGLKKDKLTLAQLERCVAIQTDFSTKMEALIYGDSDNGFCRANVNSALQAPCLAVMSEIQARLELIAAMSDPRIEVPALGTPLQRLAVMCVARNSSLSFDQLDACARLNVTGTQQLSALGVGRNADEVPKDPCAVVGNVSTAYAQCRRLIAGLPAVIVNRTRSAGNLSSSANVTREVPKPVSRLTEICNSMLASNIEVCKKFIVKEKFGLLALADKAGVGNASALETNLTMRAFVNAVCELITSPAESDDCRQLKAELSLGLAQLAAGPVPSSFSRTGPVQAAPSPAPVVVTLVERAPRCSKLEDAVGAAAGAECDLLVASVRQAVQAAVTAAGRKVSGEGSTFLERSRSVCLKLENLQCLATIAAAKARLDALATPPAPSPAPSPAPDEDALTKILRVIDGVAGATGGAAFDATGAAATGAAATGAAATGGAATGSV